MFFDLEDFCFAVEVVNGGHFHASSGNTVGGVLQDLELVYGGVADVRIPVRAGTDKGLIGGHDGFTRLFPVSAGEEFQYIESGSDSFDYFLNVLVEVEMRVNRNSQDLGVLLKAERRIIDWNYRLEVRLAVV